MATFTSKINGNDIYAKRAEATRKGVNLETYGEGASQVKGILPTGLLPGNEGTDDANILATQQYVLDQVGEVAEAMLYKGAVNEGTDLPSTGYKAGWTYKVATAGTYAGQTCEVGDLIIANKDYAAGTASNADWDVIQTNIDGAVTGPTSGSVADGELAVFDGTTGKVIEGSGILASNVKTKQTAYTASGLGTLKTITALTQNANGEISATASDIQSASTSQSGVVQLAGSVGATVASENNKAASEKAVRDAINALDATNVTGASNGITVKVSEADGVITSVAVEASAATAGGAAGLVSYDTVDL